ncbi:MAG: hypothetical protein LUC97_10800 [Clostridiales bacterium]|nr:hypothetical protein [Clostridiales bacterium]
MLNRNGKKYVTTLYKINAEDVSIFPKKAEKSNINVNSAGPIPAIFGSTPIIKSIPDDIAWAFAKVSPEKPNIFTHIKGME